jgi:hypothetical protein
MNIRLSSISTHYTQNHEVISQNKLEANLPEETAESSEKRRFEIIYIKSA